MAEEKKNPLGPVGEQLRHNVERIRTERGLTKKDVSDKVGALGRPIPPLGVSRIEAGTRRVDVDDLVALALALNVSPNALFLKPAWNDSRVELTSEFDVSARTAWLWAEGRAPANDWGSGSVEAEVSTEQTEKDEADYYKQRREYAALTHSPERLRAAEHPANAAAENLAAMVNRLVQSNEASKKDAPREGENKDAARRQLRLTKNRLDRLRNAIEEIELELNGQDE